MSFVLAAWTRWRGNRANGRAVRASIIVAHRVSNSFLLALSSWLRTIVKFDTKLTNSQTARTNNRWDAMECLQWISDDSDPRDQVAHDRSIVKRVSWRLFQDPESQVRVTVPVRSGQNEFRDANSGGAENPSPTVECKRRERQARQHKRRRLGYWCWKRIGKA
jgi:hypothetical protein